MSLFSVILGFVVGGLILGLAGYSPLEGYAVMAMGVFGSPKDLAFAIIRATPLILTGLSVAFAFRTGLFNIGAEGQFIVGALASTLVGFAIELPPWLHIPAALMAGMAAGALWGALAGWLKARYGVHEVIATIMLNWIALYLNNFVVALDGVRRLHSEASQKILDSARIDFGGVWKISQEGQLWRQANPFFDEILRAPVNAGILTAVFLTILIAWVLNRTSLGFELKAVGLNKDAAEASGIPIGRSLVLSMAVAGALAAAAGALQVMGNIREVARLAAMEGNGFDGIAVALIGGNLPWGVFGAGLFFGALKHGGPNIQPVLGAPIEIVNIVMGTIIFFLAVPGLILGFVRLKDYFFRRKP